MQQIIYVSTALDGLKMNEVQEILSVANKENKVFDLTGMLLYNGIYFLQVIEGESTAIKSLMENIKNDTRHNNVVSLGTKETDKRDFGEWTMGFVNKCRDNKKVIFDESKRSTFNPYEFKYDEAINIVKRLSSII